jgi:hypothetical protein
LTEGKLDWNAKIKAAKEACKLKCSQEPKHDFEAHAKELIVVKWAHNHEKTHHEIQKHLTKMQLVEPKKEGNK